MYGTINSELKFLFYNIFNLDDSSARGCFTWGPAIYKNTVHTHGHKKININTIRDTYGIYGYDKR